MNPSFFPEGWDAPSANQNQLFAAGWNFSQWTGLDWTVAVIGGFALLAAFHGFKLSAGRLR